MADTRRQAAKALKFLNPANLADTCDGDVTLCGTVMDVAR